MRQVPRSGVPPIGIAGDGRLARHFAHYFQLLERPFRTWSRREATCEPEQAFSECSTVLLLLRDEAIEPFVTAWPGLRSKRLVHCSGALSTSAAEAAHPLMTFGHDLYDLELYCRVPFVVDAGGTPFEQLLPGLPNRVFAIPARERAYYHALCVMAGNFSMLLWSKLFRELEGRLAIPSEAALPYLEQVATNLQRDRDRALTGPLVRGDVATIDRNLRALEGDPFHAVYAAFERAYAQRT